MPSQIRSPLSRSYGGILPSSFTTILSIALVFSTYPPVSVWGTGGSQLAHEAFLGSIGSPTPPPTGQCHHVSATRRTDLPMQQPTRLAHDNHRVGWATFLRPSAACLLPDQVTDSTTQAPEGTTGSLACLVSPASTRTLLRRYQNINWLSIDYACRPRLRSRLTQGRLA